MTFLDFLEMIGVTPEPGQRVLLKVAFCGADPIELPDDERAIARALFGPVDRIPQAARGLVCVVAGGRSGKTYFLALHLLFQALTVDLSQLAPGEKAVGAVIAPRLEEAMQSIAYISGALKADEDLAALVVRDVAGEVEILRETGQTVVLRAVAAGAGGIGGRGKSLVGVFLDETCFFRDASSGVVNDEAVYKAASPRVMAGGMTVIASTPWTSAGLLYGFYKSDFGRPTTALVAHASTRTMRTAPHILEIVAREEARDPDNARIEFGAEWGSTDVVRFFADADLDFAFVDEIERTAPEPGDLVAAAADLGFTRNSSTLCVLVDREHVLRPVRLVEHRPAPGVPLVPSEVCHQIASEVVACRARTVATDQHYRETLREHTARLGVSLYDGGAPDERFVSLRTQMRAGRIKISTRATYAARLRRQLEGVKARQLAGGKLSVSLPSDIDGSHGDLADVLARAVWARHRYGGFKIPEPVDPVQATEDELLKKQERKVAEKAGKPWWKK